VGSFVLAQKVLKRTINASSITLLQIDAENCFEVKLETGSTDEIVIEARLEGEYTKDLEIAVYENGGTLGVEAGFTANFINPNDKLSAHKVVSIALNLYLPKWKNVQVYGTNTRVMATGSYSDLSIILADGNCELNQVTQNVTVKTQSGNIFLKAKTGSVTACSKYGLVSPVILPAGANQYNLSTVTGNIELKKPE
jgi:hypothetical protein